MSFLSALHTKLSSQVEKMKKIEKNFFKIFGPRWGSLGSPHLGPQTEFPKTPR